MHIAIPQHANWLLLLRVIKAACSGELRQVPVDAEEHTSPDDVVVVVSMAVPLMVDPMHLGALKDIADPARSRDVGAIENFAKRTDRSIR